MNESRRQRALELFESAYQAQMAGDYQRAKLLYLRSIETYPTAEAYTFYGWVLSFEKRYEEAIMQCRKAIEVDPTFGNPYNDIGAYLIELGCLEEAVVWLERAKRAPRYEPRHFPHINLARVYARRGKTREAIAELKTALQHAPEDQQVRTFLVHLQARLN